MICPIFLDPWPDHWLIPGRSLFVFSYRLLEVDDDLEEDLDEVDDEDDDDEDDDDGDVPCLR